MSNFDFSDFMREGGINVAMRKSRSINEAMVSSKRPMVPIGALREADYNYNDQHDLLTQYFKDRLSLEELFEVAEEMGVEVATAKEIQNVLNNNFTLEHLSELHGIDLDHLRAKLEDILEHLTRLQEGKKSPLGKDLPTVLHTRIQKARRTRELLPKGRNEAMLFVPGPIMISTGAEKAAQEEKRGDVGDVKVIEVLLNSPSPKTRLDAIVLSHKLSL